MYQSLLLLLLSSMFIGQGLGYSKLYLFHSVFLLAGVCLVKDFNFHDLILKLKKYSILLALLGYTFVTLFWSINFKEGLVECIQLLIGGSAFLLCTSIRFPEKLKKIISVVLWVNLIISVCEGLGLFRYPYSQYSELAPYLDRNNYDWSPVKLDWPTGFHWNPNNNAYFVFFTYPLIMSFNTRLFQCVYFILASWVIYMASSKLILFGWILFSFFYLLKLVWNSKFRLRAIILLCTLVTLLVLYSSVLIKDRHRHAKYSKLPANISTLLIEIPKIIINRAASREVDFNYIGIDNSLNERLIYLDGLLKLIKENFFFGIGAGGLKYKIHYQSGKAVILERPHFFLMELFAKYGVFFFGCLIFALYNQIKKSRFLGSHFTLSIFIFILFHPVASTLNYFLPMWGLCAVVEVLYIRKKERLESNGAKEKY